MKIVGIGSSAGGLTALGEMFQNVPPTTGAAFIIAQHFSTDRDSILEEVLRSHTRMPVRKLERDTPVEADTVYFLSPEKYLAHQNGQLLVEPVEQLPATPLFLPVDVLFQTLAARQGEQTIGVILSGSGSDGSRGGRVIKEKGGLVLVQDPSGAELEGMPQAALRLGIADLILPPAQIGRQLSILLQTDEETALESLHKEASMTAVFDKILSKVSRSTNIDFTNYRESTLLRRLYQRMLVRQCTGLEHYLMLLGREEEEARRLGRDFLISVTRFFRDPTVFRFIEESLLPKIFGRGQPDEPVRIWVPGCSTGEEAYSLALLIESFLETYHRKREYKIFASDIDKNAIRLADTGLFPGSVANDLPPRLRSRFFSREGDNFRILPKIRERILFAVQDVLTDPPFIRMDLITCRNLLIYLKPAMQRNLLTNFHFALNTEGFLILGLSEHPGELKHAFSPVDIKRNVFRKKEQITLPVSPSLNQRISTTDIILADESAFPSYLPPEYTAPASADPFTRFLLEQYAPDALFLSFNLDVLYAGGDLSYLLRLPQGLMQLHSVRMLDEDTFRLFRDGVRQAQETGQAVRFKHIRFTRDNGQEVSADLKFQIVELPQWKEPVVWVELSTPTGRPPENPAVDIKPDNFLREHIRNLERELLDNRRKMKKLIDHLEATNEELQSSNREILASNEELQSVNEELHSVNEELYRVNNEMQTKNMELRMANDDITNLLESIEIGTIFLDQDLCIRRFTPAIRRQFQLLDSDVGRPITHFSSSFESLNVGKICEGVFETLQPYEEEVSDRHGDHYLLRILPYRTERNAIEGLVVTFVNINDLVKSR